MWSEPFSPLNPRHRAALFAAGLGLVIVMELATGWLLPALAAWSLEVLP